MTCAESNTAFFLFTQSESTELILMEFGTQLNELFINNDDAGGHLRPKHEHLNYRDRGDRKCHNILANQIKDLNPL